MVVELEFIGDLPSGKRLHNYGKIHHFLWENYRTISMIIFNGYVSLPEGTFSGFFFLDLNIFTKIYIYMDWQGCKCHVMLLEANILRWVRAKMKVYFMANSTAENDDQPLYALACHWFHICEDSDQPPNNCGRGISI